MRHGQPSPNRPIRWRAPLMAVICTAIVLAISWRLVDQRLAAEAARQASRGASPAVVALREDWVAAILPTALGETGPVAERARRVASARLDQAIAGATRDDHEEFKRIAATILETIRKSEAAPTPEAVRWAEWVSQRLAKTADRVAPEDRLALLASVDQTLTSLAGRARREDINPPPSQPTVVATPVVEPEPVAVLDEPPAVEWVAPLPLPIAVTPVAESTPEPTPMPEPQAWNPDWIPSKPTTPEPTARAAEPVPATLTERSDRDLLGELVQLASQLPQDIDEPYAAGPTSAPKKDEADPFADLRREVSALRAELSARGFYAVSEDQVERLLSDDAAVRVDLVARLMVEGSGGAPRLLLVLAEDPSAEVRAAAISALGSSTDQELTRIAWELALKDKSPEVGRLAENLRARLR